MELVRWALPSHRRWRRILRSLDLDPDELSRPVERPGERDFLVCGSPRTGTALLAAALWQPPGVVCVMEPWDAMRLAPAELFRSLRAEIDGGVLARGRLDVAALSDGAVRWTRDGERPVAIAMEPSWQLGVKLPAFWRYLDLLPDTRFVACVRAPEETIASYRATTGRLREGLEYDARFNEALNAELLAATDDPAVRRVLLYDRANEAVVANMHRENVHVVRYERWFDDPGGQRRDLEAFLGVDLPRLPRIERSSVPTLPPDELDLVRRECRTAAALGYAV
jgi:hypothetical protein